MKKTMEYRLNFVFILLVSLVIAGCSTVLGPPDSETGPDDPQVFTAPTSQYDLFFVGQPNPGMFTTDGAYYLWRDGNVWHLRVARSESFRFESSQIPVFTGVITVDKGIVVNLLKHQVDVRNEVDQKKDGIVFRFRPRNDVEGFDFSVRPFGVRYCVTFDLRKDQVGDPSIVHLGRSMFVPDRMPLTSCVP